MQRSGSSSAHRAAALHSVVTLAVDCGDRRATSIDSAAARSASARSPRSQRICDCIISAGCS
jgi:hypothetical protein